MDNFTETMLQLMKDVAIAFHIKCSKYEKEDLTLPLRDTLFKEALSEVMQTNDINKKDMAI